VQAVRVWSVPGSNRWLRRGRVGVRYSASPAELKGGVGD
jgi:hypothetical protein